MALKTLMVLFLLAAAFNTQGSRALKRGKYVEGEFSLGKIASYFGFGGADDDCEDCDSDGQIQNKEPDEDYEIDASDKALIKKLLYALKFERRIKRKSSSCNKPLSQQFFQKVIADCVKDVVRKVNCKELIPVDKAFLDKTRERAHNASDNLVLQLDAKFSIVKQALDNINPSSVSNSNFNRKDVEDSIEQIINTSLLQVKPTVEFIHVNTMKYGEKLKTVREIINENVKTFTNSLLTSRCVSVRKSSTAFCKCVEPIYIRFTCNLRKSIEKVDDLSKSVQNLEIEALAELDNEIDKVLKSAEIKANEILNGLADLLTVDTGINREEYLKNKANEVLKQLESIITKLNTVCKNILDALNEEINKTLNNKLREVVDTFQPLIEVINNFSDLNCTRVNITVVKETTQKYIDESSESIKNIFSKLCFLKFKKVENERQALENKSRDLLEKYSAENVDIKCKKLNSKVYIYCVNATYNEFQITVNALDKKRKEVHAKLTNNITKDELNLFNEKTATILKAVEKYVNKTAEKLNKLAEIPKQNDEFIKASIKKYQEIVEEQVNSLSNCKIQGAINGTNENFKNISNKFVTDLTTVVTSLSGNPLDSKDEAFIQEYVNLLNSTVNGYRNKLNDYEDSANVLLNSLVNVASQYTMESLKVACASSYCNATDLAACVNAKFESLNKEIEKTVEELTKVLDKVKNTEAESNININKEAEKLLEEAKNSYNESIKDRNSPEDSAAIISNCLTFVDDKLHNVILPKIDELFKLSKGLSDYILTFNLKLDNLDAIIREAVADLDNLIVLYPKEAEKYKKQKENFNALQQQAKDDIQSNIGLSTDNANNFEITVDELQKTILYKLSDVNVDTLSKSCEAVYKSKSEFTSCIEKECDKIKEVLKEVEKEVSESEQVGNSIIENAKTEIKKSVESESSKVEEAAKKIKEEFNLNREPDDNNETTSAQRLAECTDSVNQRIKTSLNVLINEVLAIYEDLKVSVKDSTIGLKEKLQATFKTEIDALDFVISLYPKSAAKYTTQKANINASIDDTITRINNIVAQNLDSFSAIISQVNQIKQELSARQTEFIQNLNRSCEAVYSSKKNYSKCIDEQCTKFNKYLNETENTLTKLVDESNVLYVGNLNNVTSSVGSEISKAEDKAKKDTEALFKENNVTQQTIENIAFSELSKYNVTPLLNNLKLINDRAVELQNREISANRTAFDWFGIMTNSLSLHQSVAYEICPRVPISNEVKYANSTIIETRDAVVLTSPSQMAYVYEQLNFSAYYNTLLKNEIQLLQPENIKADCKDVLSDTVKLFQCLKDKVNRFGDAFNKSGAAVKIEAQDATAELINRSNILKSWLDGYVNGEFYKVAANLQPIAESIYTGPCNATKEKLLDFAQQQIDNRYKGLKPIIDKLAENVSIAASAAIPRDYKNIVNITSKLESTMDWYKKALEDAKKKNSSYVTQDKIAETQKVIGVGIGKFDKFVNEIPKNATIAKENATQFVAEAQNWYKITDKKAAEAKCYKENVPNPYSAFIQCNNGFAYDFQVGLVERQKKLEESLSKLNAVNNLNGKKFVNDYADQLQTELITRSALLSITVYIENKIDIPDYLVPYLSNKCLASGMKPSECIITT